MRLFDLPVLGADSLAFSHDGRLLAVWTFGRVFLIDIVAGAVRPLQPESDGVRYGTPGIGFTSDDQCVIAFRNLGGGRYTAAVRVYDVASGKVRRSIEGEGLRAMEPSADGCLVYLAIKPWEGPVEIIPWDPIKGKKRRGFGRHVGFLHELAVSADGQWVAGFHKDEIRIWSLAGGKRPTRAFRRVRPAGWHSIGAIALSADGTLVAAEGGAGVAVWDVRTGAEQRITDWGGDRSRSVAFHPTRPVLVYPTRSNEVVFWDTEFRSELRKFVWGIGWLNTLMFSPDGMMCAATSGGKVVVWDVDF
jgi:WD40 repeat protein